MNIRKVSKLKACVYRVMESLTLSVRDCMTMLGMFTAAILAVPWVRFHMRAFQMSFLGEWDSWSLDQKIFAPVQMQQSLTWWTLQETLSRGMPLSMGNWVLITSDASLRGWRVTQTSWNCKRRIWPFWHLKKWFRELE